MVLLMVITVGYLPIVLPLLLPGVSVNPAQIAQSLVLLMLLPLGSALALKANRPGLAATIKPFFDKTSNLSLIALMTLQTLLNVRSVMAVFGTGGILAGVLFLAVGFVVGWALGGAATETRSVLGLGTAQRNIAAALVVANQSFDDPERRRDGCRDCDRRAVDPHAAVARAWAGSAGGSNNGDRLRRRRFHFAKAVPLSRYRNCVRHS